MSLATISDTFRTAYGTGFTQRVTWYSASLGTAQSLSGATVSGYVKRRESDSDGDALRTLTAAVDSASTGKTSYTLADSLTLPRQRNLVIVMRMKLSGGTTNEIRQPLAVE